MKNPSESNPQLKALHEALDRIRVAPAYQPGKWFVGPLNLAPETPAGLNLPRRVDICDVTLAGAAQASFGTRE